LAKRATLRESIYDRIYRVIRMIPAGKVATYGQVSYLVGPPCTPRRVGWALAALRTHVVEVPVPWQRVVNAKGESSVGNPQISLLKEEGICFDARGRIDLDRFGWDSLDWDSFEEIESAGD
jgi:methylated-DNA-protein-cysteine methyltransferase-like protein